MVNATKIRLTKKTRAALAFLRHYSSVQVGSTEYEAQFKRLSAAGLASKHAGGEFLPGEARWMLTIAGSNLAYEIRND